MLVETRRKPLDWVLWVIDPEDQNLTLNKDSLACGYFLGIWALQGWANLQLECLREAWRKQWSILSQVGYIWVVLAGYKGKRKKAQESGHIKLWILCNTRISTEVMFHWRERGPSAPRTIRKLLVREKPASPHCPMLDLFWKPGLVWASTVTDLASLISLGAKWW